MSIAMRALDRGSTADIVFQRPCFATVEEDEALDLSLWRFVRDGDDAAATGLAHALVSVGHADAVVAGFARVLAER